MDQVQEILQAEAVGLLLFNQARNITPNHDAVKAYRENFHEMHDIVQKQMLQMQN